MQPLSNVDLGPKDATQLRCQPDHRSMRLWGRPTAGQVVLGVLKCRRQPCSLPQVGLDLQITRYITEAGLEGLFKVPELEVDHALITSLVERWHQETHMFHLLHGEMGITLQDIEVMLEVLMDGLLVVRKTKLKWKELSTELLGHQPLDPIPHPNENKSILAGARIRVSWLEARFRGPLAADVSDAVVQQHARYHILV